MGSGVSYAVLRFSAVAFGSRIVPSEEVDAAFNMPAGELRHRAGILSLAYVSAEEAEVTLAARAAAEMLPSAQVAPERLVWIIAAGATHSSLPFLAAQTHSAPRAP